LFPNKDQKEKLNQWFGLHRWTYNQCVGVWKQFNDFVGFLNAGKHVKKQSLRSIYKKKDSWFLKDKKWVFDVPANVRDEAITEFITTKAQAKLKYYRKNKKPMKLKTN